MSVGDTFNPLCMTLREGLQYPKTPIFLHHCKNRQPISFLDKNKKILIFHKVQQLTTNPMMSLTYFYIGIISFMYNPTNS